MSNQPPSLVAAAQAFCAHQDFPSALYIVATPIGNLADIGLRALAVLAGADRVAAEDTRVAQRLLDAYGLRKPLLRCDRHREAEAAPTVLADLAEGRRVAYVSDAGTPGVSDPGSRLAQAVLQAGQRVIPVPGASAVSTALSACGLDLDAGYIFAGFAPSTQKALQIFLQTALLAARPTVFFEAPHRIGDCLRALVGLQPDAHLVVAKELTKQFEALVSGTPAELLSWLEADPRRQQGEFVLIVAPPPQREAALDDKTRALLERLARELPASRAAAVVAEVSGVPRDTLYRWLSDHKRD